MSYAHVVDGQIVATGGRPNWWYDDGSPVSDERLAQDGWLPIMREEPQYDPLRQTAAEDPMAAWEVHADRVLVTWTVSDMALSERKAALRDAVNDKLDALLTGGYTVQSGAMAGKVLQTRLEDRTNWLVSQASYSAAVAAGQGAVEGARFRTADNATYTLTFADGLAVLLAMAAWGAACMDRSWALKDAIVAAEDQAALDLIDIEAGWPGA